MILIKIMLIVSYKNQQINQHYLIVTGIVYNAIFDNQRTILSFFGSGYRTATFKTATSQNSDCYKTATVTKREK